MKFNKTTIALVLSVLLNVLNNTGTVDPIVAAPTPCPVCPVCAK